MTWEANKNTDATRPYTVELPLTRRVSDGKAYHAEAIADVYGTEETARERAALIAAAPRMLEALEAADEAFDGTRGSGEAWDMVAAAIATAKGERNR